MRVGKVVGSSGGTEFQPHRVQRNVNRRVFVSENKTASAATAAATVTATARWPRFLWFVFFQFAYLSVLFTFVVLEHADDREQLSFDVDLFAERNDFAANFLR